MFYQTKRHQKAPFEQADEAWQMFLEANPKFGKVLNEED
jgi:hypothetical protein